MSIISLVGRTSPCAIATHTDCLLWLYLSVYPHVGVHISGYSSHRSLWYVSADDSLLFPSHFLSYTSNLLTLAMQWFPLILSQFNFRTGMKWGLVLTLLLVWVCSDLTRLLRVLALFYRPALISIAVAFQGLRVYAKNSRHSCLVVSLSIRWTSQLYLMRIYQTPRWTLLILFGVVAKGMT